jgi:hypothetical protein
MQLRNSRSVIGCGVAVAGARVLRQQAADFVFEQGVGLGASWPCSTSSTAPAGTG